MRRVALFLLGLSTFATAAPRAHAQLIPTTPTTTGTSNSTGTAINGTMTVRYRGDEFSSATILYVNTVDCDPDQNNEIEFELTGYITSSTISELEVWSSTNTDCFSSAGRMLNTTSQRSCRLVDAQSGVSGTVKFKIPARRLFDSMPDANPQDARCDPVTNSKFTVYFVPLANSSQSDSARPPDPIAGIQQASVTFTLYTRRPEPPTGVEASSGENALGLSWDRIASGDARTRYRAFFDYGNAATATMNSCGSGALEPPPVAGEDAGADAGVDAGDTMDAGEVDAGEEEEEEEADAGADADAGEAEDDDDDNDGVDPPPAGTPFVWSGEVKGTKASLKGLESKGIYTGNFVRAAVATVDVAENIGYLSERVCIQRVETISFIDACNADPDCAGQLESCSLSPANGGSAISLSLLALGFAALRRRRRSA